ncbi:MAG: hypothetical protein WBO36_03650, partial [Saprospiraceae bacterium]
ALFMTSTVFGATCEHPHFASFIHGCVARHQSGDWGDALVLCKSNEAIRNGFISEELQPTGLQLDTLFSMTMIRLSLMAAGYFQCILFQLVFTHYQTGFGSSQSHPESTPQYFFHQSIRL